ncbi:MAG: SAM-dependent methyltransferase [Butyricicoccus pullicaecorum]|nr:SAM-dependent methyltransferase [Butyricicoccus pullicaecorum]MDO4668636.1 SAM-dependent methyltransferase [Butyricicoccus pullicaecorum]
MQKGEKNKLKLLLIGIQARLKQNRDYFVSATFEFKSGNQKFRALLKDGDQGDYVLSFQGTERIIDAEEAVSFFEQQADVYENAVLTYTERGSVMTITVSARGVSMKQTEQQAEPQETVVNPLLDQGRKYLIQVDKASALLREIGILTADGKIKNDMIRKYNQIDHYVELVAPMFEQDDSEEILLLDCACGKSYLSFVMNYYLRDVLRRRCRIVGIDINPHVVSESQKMAKRLGYHNMEFITADLRTYQPPKHVTAVISLHACDIATDLALSTAIRAKAKYIACVPCCHKELLDQYTLPGLEPLMRHGVFKARFNDVLTDSMRALKLEAEGYKVSVVEYISPLDTPKNLLIRATRTKQDNDKARAAYEQVRELVGTTSELDRRCAENDAGFFITDEDLF